jgi:hypothetical protein
MAIIRETSYTSTSTYYDLNSVSASHSGTTLTVTINLTIQGGSVTSLGAAESRIRNVYLYDGGGSRFNEVHQIKNASMSWGTNFNGNWTLTFNKYIGYDGWSSNCYIRIGTNEDWNTAPSPNSFWWPGRKSTSTGTAGQTFNVGVGSTYVLPSVSSPASTTVNSGSTASFGVSASGGAPASYSYQWQLSTNGGGSYSSISGANQIEAYYGLAATTWSEDIVSGELIKGSYITEMRQALERIRSYINSLASAAFQIPAFVWTDTTLTNKRIKAVHLNELRNKIGLL